jgi:hypothetical protein
VACNAVKRIRLGVSQVFDFCSWLDLTEKEKKNGRAIFGGYLRHGLGAVNAFHLLGLCFRVSSSLAL